MQRESLHEAIESLAGGVTDRIKMGGFVLHLFVGVVVFKHIRAGSKGSSCTRSQYLLRVERKTGKTKRCSIAFWIHNTVCSSAT